MKSRLAFIFIMMGGFSPLVFGCSRTMLVGSASSHGEPIRKFHFAWQLDCNLLGGKKLPWRDSGFAWSDEKGELEFQTDADVDDCILDLSERYVARHPWYAPEDILSGLRNKKGTIRFHYRFIPMLAWTAKLEKQKVILEWPQVKGAARYQYDLECNNGFGRKGDTKSNSTAFEPAKLPESAKQSEIISIHSIGLHMTEVQQQCLEEFEIYNCSFTVNARGGDGNKSVLATSFVQFRNEFHVLGYPEGIRCQF
ncbi:MAG: hypothetical protein KDK27_20350 [Leptospiraceae bacterium]|nr:hypothetical protein [Leptospiraceae bacterium]